MLPSCLNLLRQLRRQHALIVVLTFLRVQEHVELAAENLLSHELTLDVRGPTHAHIRIDIELLGDVLDTAGQSIRLDRIILLCLLIKEFLVVVVSILHRISL